MAAGRLSSSKIEVVGRGRMWKEGRAFINVTDRKLGLDKVAHPNCSCSCFQFKPGLGK